MNKEWNLDILYAGFDDPKYSEDTALLTKEIDALGALASDISNVEEEKLVSEYIAISEKLKGELTGLEQAQLNVQDTVSLLQTAEGGMGTLHNMLNRMAELCTKAANGIYDTTDKDAIKQEVTALSEEITRITVSTKFNNTVLLGGSLSTQLQIGSESTDTINVACSNLAASELDVDALDVSAADKYVALYARPKT